MRVLQLGLSIRRTAVGKGVFAMKAYRKGQALGQVHGQVHRDDADYDQDYVMDFGEHTVLEPSAPFRFLNHSCEPNAELVELEPQDSSEPSAMWVYAIRTIRPEDQVTIDYAWPADAAIPCHCGSPKCRGWVVDLAEVPKMLRRAKATARAKNATSVNRAKAIVNRPRTPAVAAASAKAVAKTTASPKTTAATQRRSAAPKAQ